jgi:hypothetical protein
MAVDKRFWSGAIIVVTVAVAGAGALPALLLHPPGLDAGSVEALPVAAMRAEAKPFDVKPVDVKPLDPKPADPKPLAQLPDAVPDPLVVPLDAEPASFPQPANLPQPAGLVQPASAQPALQTRETAARTAPAPASVQAQEPAQPLSFPPVQPVDLSTGAEMQAATAPLPAQSNPADAKPPVAQAARPGPAVAQRNVAQRRSVRPAKYPIREFLAWRR